MVVLYYLNSSYDLFPDFLKEFCSQQLVILTDSHPSCKGQLMLQHEWLLFPQKLFGSFLFKVVDYNMWPVWQVCHLISLGDFTRWRHVPSGLVFRTSLAPGDKENGAHIRPRGFFRNSEYM